MSWLAAAVAFAIGFASYANTLGHDFVWDDLLRLEDKIRFYDSPLDVFFEPQELPGYRVYRPVTFGTYWTDQAIWWRDPFGYHLTNVLLHSACCVLVYVLAFSLVGAIGPSLVAASLFAVHPIHTEAVAWMAGRGEPLAAAFAVTALIAFLRVRARSEWASLAVIGVATFLAVSSKENGAVVPVLLIAVAAAVPRPGREIRTGSYAERLRFWSPWVWKAVGAGAAGLFVYLALRPNDRTTGLRPSAFDLEGIADLLAAFGFYVGRTLFPFDLMAYIPEPPAGSSVNLLAVAALAATGVLVCSRHGDGGLRRLSVIWFAVTIAMPAMVVLAELSATAVAERYVYLPSIGLSLLVAGELAVRPALLRSTPVVVALGLALTGLAATTMSRNTIWKDEIALWSDVTRKDSRYTMPYNNLGFALSTAGRLDEAEQALTAALEASGPPLRRRSAHLNLGFLRLKQGDVERAVTQFEAANAIEPHAAGYKGLGLAARKRARALRDAGDLTGAARELTLARNLLVRALKMDPRYHLAYFDLGGVFYDGGDYASAIAQYRRVVELAPDSPTGRDAARAAQQLETWLARNR